MGILDDTSILIIVKQGADHNNFTHIFPTKNLCSLGFSVKTHKEPNWIAFSNLA
jgi:hypothetical protein